MLIFTLRGCTIGCCWIGGVTGCTGAIVVIGEVCGVLPVPPDEEVVPEVDDELLLVELLLDEELLDEELLSLLPEVELLLDEELLSLLPEDEPLFDEELLSLLPEEEPLL